MSASSVARNRVSTAVRPEGPALALSMRRIRLAVLALDPLSQAGISSHVARRPDMELLSTDQVADAEVVVIAAPALNVQVMEQLRALAEQADSLRALLILDRLGDADLLAAVEFGVAAILWRSDATVERFGQTVVTVSRGGSDLPLELQAKLIADVAELHRTVLTPRGLTASGLDARELDVLRYIAEGLDTAEIAKRMLYSERTVKGILYALMARLNLRNRSHAVAYAMRSGVL